MAQVNIRNIPDEIHKAFKIICVKKGITLNDYYLQIIKKEVERNKKRRIVNE